MRDARWTLEYEGVSLGFGGPRDRIMFDGPPERGQAKIRVDDVDRPRADGIAFGRDYRGGDSWTFPLAIFERSEEEAREIAAEVARAWRGDVVRATPGGVAVLRSRLGTRERQVYGRPRRFAQDDTEAPEGVILLTTDFACVDDAAYGVVEHVQDVRLVPPPSGGIVSPLGSPLTTTAPAESPGAVEIGGDLPSWPILTIEGPITNPSVEATGSWLLDTTAQVAEGDAVIFDSRPWRRTITRRSDGASLAGALTRFSTRLSGLSLTPGSHEIALRGLDETGLASLRFAWRDTYSAL